MSRTDRLYKMSALLKRQRVVARQEMMDKFEVSHASFKRDLEYIRSRMGIPIIYDRDLGGYRIDPDDPMQRVEIPDLWFSDEEALALITMHHLLASVDEIGLIAPHVDSIQKRLEAVLKDVGTDRKELMERVKLIAIGDRRHNTEHFKTVGAALFGRKQLEMEFFTKGTGSYSKRVISPQRLIRYRDNWYVDAWCHHKERLQTFSLDGIQSAKVLADKALSVDRKQLDAMLKSSYGIFSGKADKVAKLRFTPERARWVSLEDWHSEQRGAFDNDKHYLLEVPYSDDRELVMDILRHGPEVTVLDPPELRDKVAKALKAAAEMYGG